MTKTFFLLCQDLVWKVFYEFPLDCCILLTSIFSFWSTSTLAGGSIKTCDTCSVPCATSKHKRLEGFFPYTINDCSFDPVSPSWVKCKIKSRLLESCSFKGCIFAVNWSTTDTWQCCLRSQLLSVRRDRDLPAEFQRDCRHPCRGGVLEAPAGARRLTDTKTVTKVQGENPARCWLI